MFYHEKIRKIQDLSNEISRLTNIGEDTLKEIRETLPAKEKKEAIKSVMVMMHELDRIKKLKKKYRSMKATPELLHHLDDMIKKLMLNRIVLEKQV